MQIDLHLVGDAAMDQRLVERFVGVLQAGIFADHGDRHFAIGIGDGLGDLPPAFEVGLGRIGDAESGQHLAVEALGVVGERHVVDVCTSSAWITAFGAHIAEQRDLAPLVLGSGRSLRHSRMSGWMPMERSSFTECCVGLVLSSPALGM